jgi:sugar phosphate isomerase/epimerase
MKDIALGWLTAADAGHVGLIHAAAAAGFGSVSLKLLPGGGDPLPPVIGDPAMVRDIRDALAESGLALLEMGGVWLRPDSRIEDVLAGLDLGAELGAKHVVAVGGDADRGRLLHTMSLLAEAAGQRGLGVAIEFIVYSAIRTVHDGLAVALATGQANCGVLVDALHLDRSGGSPADLATIPPERIFIAQLCDAPAASPSTPEALRHEARSRRRSPGEGELPLRAFLKALPEGVPIELEVPCADLAHLPPTERIGAIAAATRRFLSAER